MLRPYRVLDLTDDRAALGPMILADLGADVIKIEPFLARRARSRLPSLGRDSADPRSVAFNRNKRSVVADIMTEPGRDSFRRLVASADFLFENSPPGTMAARGLGFDDLRQINPALVHVAITPFGQDGPYAQHLATDLTLAAMGGMVALTGDADRPPIRISAPQVWLHAAAESAVAALVAHRRRLQTGEAQFVDVSVQAAVVWTLLNAMTAHAIQGKNFERNGTVVALGNIDLPVMYRCADGFTVISPNLILPTLISWMVDEAIVEPSWLTDEDWPTYFERLFSGETVSHPFQQIAQRIQAFTERHTKRDLLERGLPSGIFFAPVNTVADLLEFDQLQARTYWQVLTLPDGQEVRAPGPFVRFSETPIMMRPTIAAAGDDTASVFSERARATSPTKRLSGNLPFSGIKIADFSWVAVGPIAAKYLADHGATVVHVESSVHADVLRRAGPFTDGIFGPNRSQYFGAFNTSKQSIALDLKNPAGKRVAERLLAWADICLESFTPGTMAGLGLDYESARRLNPSLIMASTCLMGQSGPAAALAGYGFHAAAVSGFPELTGWPDRPPSGPWAAYTDTIANRFLAASIMAALDHRQRTGRGQYIDQSQMESALHFLAPQILEHQMRGVLPTRSGNDAPKAAPHAVYPCLGEDKWCAIAIENDQQWQALCRVLDAADLAASRELADISGRIAHRQAIDQRIAAWTSTLGTQEAMDRLQAAGIPAGAVQRSSDLLADPQLQHRGFFRRIAHPEMGTVPYEGHQFRIRDYDSGPRSAAPCLGEHSIEVLRELLGMSDDEIAEIAASGALI